MLMYKIPHNTVHNFTPYMHQKFKYSKATYSETDAFQGSRLPCIHRPTACAHLHSNTQWASQDFGDWVDLNSWLLPAKQTGYNEYKQLDAIFDRMVYTRKTSLLFAQWQTTMV